MRHQDLSQHVDNGLLFSQICKVTALALVALGSGLLVLRHGVRVNYTRKINHFALFCLPPWIDILFDVPNGVPAGIANGLSTGLLFAFFMAPVRARVPIAQTMFASYDRPEDRPHTLMWIVTQYLAGLAVIVPIMIYFDYRGFGALAMMVVLITIVGDGLAEPVGVRYGKRKYSVPGLFVDRKYERSFMGSLCVLVVGAAGVVMFQDNFTIPQFVAALLVLPITVTLTEAVSPHTWDTPFLFLAGGLCVAAVKNWVP